MLAKLPVKVYTRVPTVASKRLVSATEAGTSPSSSGLLREPSLLYVLSSSFRETTYVDLPLLMFAPLNQVKNYLYAILKIRHPQFPR
nr:hypothetical protein HmN_000978200 [Hymenolepis microstoma]